MVWGWDAVEAGVFGSEGDSDQSGMFPLNRGGTTSSITGDSNGCGAGRLIVMVAARSFWSYRTNFNFFLLSNIIATPINPRWRLIELASCVLKFGSHQ